MVDYKRLIDGFRHCRHVGDCKECLLAYECHTGTLYEEAADAIERLLNERDAAVKCAQRFSYCNERKCRWCRFGALDEDKEWDCNHPRRDEPTKGNPFAYPCRLFEYVYREENAK